MDAVLSGTVLFAGGDGIPDVFVHYGTMRPPGANTHPLREFVVLNVARALATLKYADIPDDPDAYDLVFYKQFFSQLKVLSEPTHLVMCGSPLSDPWILALADAYRANMHEAGRGFSASFRAPR